MYLGLVLVFVWGWFKIYVGAAQTLRRDDSGCDQDWFLVGLDVV